MFYLCHNCFLKVPGFSTGGNLSGRLKELHFAISFS
jgi:hypothetical protein